ncbi:MAG TPA: DUF5947 family protein, partial [Polyangia bacterium]
MISLRAIAPFVRRPQASAGPRCELCGGAIGVEHRHLVDIVERKLRCSCPACALLFQQPGQRFRAAPDRWLHDPASRLDDRVWSSLQIPVRLAFFFRHGDGWAAFYPGPAGATESLVPLDAWQQVESSNSLTLLPDVEALLVHRLGREREHYLVSVDHCYRLV